MKFKGEPNLFVRIVNERNQRLTGKKGFYFDDKGEFETDNVNMITLLKQNFEVVEEVVEDVVEDVVDTNTDINIGVNIDIDTETAEKVTVVEETKPKPKGRVK